MAKNLQMPLIKKWFDLTRSGEKKEDYREINPYWFRRFFKCSDINNNDVLEFVKLAKEGRGVNWFGEWELIFLKEFKHNVMTLGYPIFDDRERYIHLEHKGIEIRTGRKEWGAEPNKLYFVIKHGEIIK